MNEINDPGIGDYLRRRLNINDTPAPAPGLAPEVFPILDVKPRSAEDLFLRGERMCGTSQAAPVVAGEYGVISLTNPAGSNLIVVIDEVTINTAVTTANLLHYLIAPTLVSTTPKLVCAWDSRWGFSATRGSAEVRQFNTPTAPPTAPLLFASRWTTGIPPQRYAIPIILAPGSMYIIFTEAVAQSMALNIAWRERPAQPSELG